MVRGRGGHASVLLGDIGLAVALLAVALFVQRLPFLTIDGARVLWMGGGLVTGVLAVLPHRRWWPFIVLYAAAAAGTLAALGWPADGVVVRVIVDTAVVAGVALVLRRGGWLLMRDPTQVWTVAAVGVTAGVVRAIGAALAAWLSASPEVARSAQLSVVVLSTLLGLLTAAPLVALGRVDGFLPHGRRERVIVLARTLVVAAAIGAVLILAGPIAGDIRIGVLLFVVLAYAALRLPAAILAALLLLGSAGSVAVAVTYLSAVGTSGGTVTLQSGALIILPLAGLTLMCWILYSVGNSERWAARRISAIMDSLLDPHVLMTPLRDGDGDIVDFRIIEANEAGAVDHGTSRAGLVGSRLSEVSPSEVDSEMLGFYARTLETGEPLVLDGYRIADDARGGEVRAFDLRAVRMADGLIVTWRDVTEREEEATALAEREHRYRLLAENATDLVFFVGADERLAWVSPSIEPVLGYLPADLVGRDGRELMHPDDHAPDIRMWRLRDAEVTGPLMQRVRLRAASGAHRWFEVTYRAVHEDSGEVVGGVVAARDIDAEIQASQELEREMSFDSLTGLARRGLAVRRIQQVLDRDPARRWTLIVAGVDRLTLVNTAYGLHGGDHVLQAVAERLVDATGSHDRVSRIGGDEFAVLLPETVGAAAAAREASRLLDAIRGPVQLPDGLVEVTACAGISIASGRSAEVLLAEAAAAMRRATKAGPDRWEFLDGDAGEESRLALARERVLRTALTERRIHAWFMPIVDLATGRIHGYEALARCIDVDGAVLPAADFLPAAEASGAVLELDREMLRQSIDALTRLPADVHVAVNVSGASLATDDFLDRARAWLMQSEVAPSRLHLEVTETTLVHVAASTAQRMSILADLGATWWVDDFGTGFSSISHLRDLPIGGLKLDRSFTAGVHDRRGRAARLAEGLAGLANGLGLLTVAEGIEDDAQGATLGAQGWRLGQGFLYGRAMPLADVLQPER